MIRYIGILGPKGCFSNSACRALLFERVKIPDIPAMQGPCDSSLCWASGWLNAQCQMPNAWHQWIQWHNPGVPLIIKRHVR